MKFDSDRLDEIVDLMLETVCTARKRVRIAGDDYPAELVKSKFMKLDGEHIRFVLDCMRENTTKMKKLILFELRKVFSKRLALIALIGIILFSALLSFSTFQNKYAFDPNIGEGTGKTAVEIDKEIAAKYEGILTDEKVQQIMSDFAPTSDLHGLSAIYVYQNAMQSAAFSRFSDKEGNWNGLSVSDVFGNEEIKIGYAPLDVLGIVDIGRCKRYQMTNAPAYQITVLTAGSTEDFCIGHSDRWLFCYN